MRLNVREVAAGKWRGILEALGFSASMLNGKHQPCPLCRDGKDRFRWDDRDGSGSYFCSHCGAGSGIDLVMRFKGVDFKTAAQEIERAAGFVRPEESKPEQSDDAKVKALRRVWKESFPLSGDSPVERYLRGRGLVVPQSTVLRYHPDLAYRDGDQYLGKFNAMLALVQAPDGSGATLHRTYLNFDGTKAVVPKARKLMPGLPLSGAAIRLFPADLCVGIAEGIETAVAASMRFSIPVWSAVSAGGLASFVPPPEAKEVVICSDNDENMVGQKAAYELAARLTGQGIKVRVEIPDRVGADWADL